MASKSMITISGRDYTAYSDLESVEVDNNVVMTSDTMKVSIWLRGELPRPEDGNEILWLNDSGEREFGGVVTQVEEHDWGVDLEYRITAMSYERWLDRYLVVGYYDQQVPDLTVKQIVSKFCPGFTTNNVMPALGGYVQPPHFFNYVKPSDAIKKVAQMCEFGYYVDYYRDLHWYPIENFASPISGNVLNADTDVTNYGDMVIKEDGSQKKTRVYLKGFKSRVATPITLNFVGDGQSKQWNLGYPPSRYKDDVTVTVGGSPLTIKRDLVEGTPGQNTTETSSVFVNYWQNLIRLNFAPPAGTIIQVVMYYMADTVIMRENVVAQTAAAKADGEGKGVYEYAVTERGLSQSTIDAANSRGDQIMYKYGYPSTTVTFNSFTQGWRSGQSFTLVSDRRLGGLNMTMYVRQVTKKIVKADDGGLLIQYAVSCADIPYLA